MAWTKDGQGTCPNPQALKTLFPYMIMDVLGQEIPFLVICKIDVFFLLYFINSLE